MTQSADVILNTAPARAHELLGKSETDARLRFRKLAAAWHPDKNPDPQAGEVMRHLVKLRDAVLARAAPTPQVTYTSPEGKSFGLRPLASRQTDLGILHIGGRTLTQVFEPDMADLAQVSEAAEGAFRFADARMEEQMRKFLPRTLEWRDLQGGGRMQIMKREPGEVLLADLIEQDGPIEPRHAAWICSGLMNIAAWLSWAGRVHGAIAPDAILVDPAQHAVRLAGGWGFSCQAGTRPLALPGRSLETTPRLAVAGETANAGLDLELIRRTVREVMGAGASSQLGSIDLPEAVRTWLIVPPPSDGIADYTAWQAALEAGWGKRRFVTYPRTAADLYTNTAS